ncbi:hypothetical protein ACQ3HE_06760 [Plantibacter auratus]|uniref:hypothetical protein n=1 Tax=Plantibacter auratus TaxID=272914 RepID=UPI003D357045
MDNTKLIAEAREHFPALFRAPGSRDLIDRLVAALEAAEAELTRRDTVPGTWACIKCGRGAFEHSAPDLPSGDCVAEMYWKEAAADPSLEAAKAQASEEGYQRGVAAMRASAAEAHAFEEGMFEVIKHRFSGRGLGTRQAIIDAFAAFLRDPESAAAPVSLEAAKAEAWDEGKEAAYGSFLKPLDGRGMRPGPVNPYRRHPSEGGTK